MLELSLKFGLLLCHSLFHLGGESCILGLSSSDLVLESLVSRSLSGLGSSCSLSGGFFSGGDVSLLLSSEFSLLFSSSSLLSSDLGLSLLLLGFLDSFKTSSLSLLFFLDAFGFLSGSFS